VFKLLSTAGEQSIDLQLGRKLVVGRAVTSDVPIYDPTISRRHAEIVLTESGVHVTDLGSSNGTFLNGAKITEAEAGANDVVTFGKVAFRVKEVTAPVPRPQVVRPPDFASPKPGVKGGVVGGTIVRQLPVSGGVPAIVIDQPQGWLGGTVKVDWPILVNLRLDPFERIGLTGSLAFYNWFVYEFWRFVYVQQESRRVRRSTWKRSRWSSRKRWR